jgi:hypothetical protein
LLKRLCFKLPQILLLRLLRIANQIPTPNLHQEMCGLPFRLRHMQPTTLKAHQHVLATTHHLRRSFHTKGTEVVRIRCFHFLKFKNLKFATNDVSGIHIGKQRSSERNVNS